MPPQSPLSTQRVAMPTKHGLSTLLNRRKSKIGLPRCQQTNLLSCLGFTRQRPRWGQGRSRGQSWRLLLSRQTCACGGARKGAGAIPLPSQEFPQPFPGKSPGLSLTFVWAAVFMSGLACHVGRSSSSSRAASVVLFSPRENIA